MRPHLGRMVARWWPLALLAVLSGGLRLFALGRQALWADEAISWSVSRLDPTGIIALSEWDHHAPLYYLLLKASLTVLPASDAGLRVLSVAASALALMAILIFLTREWSRSAAVYAGVLLAVSSFDLYYAQEARMYTVLAAAWIVSYIGLVKALQGKPRWLIVWAVGTAALAWTHMYGLVVVAAYVAFVVGYLVLKRLMRLTMPLPDRVLLLSLLAVGLAVTPMLRILLLHSGTSTLAAWVPTTVDLRDLYLLWTAGLTASRHRFLDGNHLTLPLTAMVTASGWLLIGTLVAGAPAVVGLVHAWRLKGQQRLEATLAVTLIALPVAVAFGYSVARGSAIWIQRPFLGAAYLVYLWVGIGFAALPWRCSRWALAALATVAALASLLPYFTIWQKSDARQAFNSIPALDERNALLLEPRYLASLVRFYRGADTPMLAIEANEQGGVSQVIQPRFETGHPYIKVFGNTYPVTCGALADVTDVWLYGQREALHRILPQLPSCLIESNLWVFEEGQWTLLPALVRDTIDGAGWLQFNDIRNAEWTDESYRHLNPGDAFAVKLIHAQTGGRWLTIRHYDTPGRVLDLWADDQRLATIGGSGQGANWVEETVALPAPTGDSMLIVIKNVGPEATGITSLRVGP